MTPILILTIMVIYFGILIVIANVVGRKDSGNEAFFMPQKIRF